MTAEIAVLNKFGISIAADSAVTVETFHDGEVKQKVYNSTNKIFALSKHAPIGLMYYNTVTLGGVPWETIVKSYRKKLDKKVFPILDDYYEDFFKYLTENTKLFTDEEIRRIVFNNFFRALINMRPLKSKKEFIESIDKNITDLQKEKEVEGFGDAYIDSVCDKYKDEINKAQESALPPSYIKGNKQLMRNLFHLLLQKKKLFSEYSGLVICGFGEDEYMPRLQEYMIDIHLGDKVRHWKSRDIRIDGTLSSDIIPFADTEVIRTLIDGISPGFWIETTTSAVKLMLGIPAKILDGIVELNADQKKKYLNAALMTLPQHFKDYLEEQDQYRQENYTNPIKGSISSLPISELGAVSEALLNSSQILKRVKPDIETVGGPVDVATISKGDGFVWVKRKHYFQPDINHAFINRYMES